LRWLDLTTCDKSWLARWWTAKLKYPFDSQDWVDLLQVRPTVDSGWWQLFALSYGIDETADVENYLSNEDRVRLFYEQFPEDQGMILIALLGEAWSELGRFLVWHGEENYEWKNPVTEITSLFALSLRFRQLQVNDDWLAKTHHYASFHGGRNPEDLLASCERSLADAEAAGLVLDPHLVGEFRDLLSELFARRQRLAQLA